MKVKKEIIKIQVRVEIEFEEDNKESRNQAIKTAKENVIGINTYGYPVSAKTLTSKLI